MCATEAVELRQARVEELPALSALCLRSKGHWGYDAAFLAACREELTVTQAMLGPHLVVAEAAGTAVGLARIAVEDGTADLELLYIEPDRIGSGLGRRLFDWAVAAARSAGATDMVIEADPQAAPFYRRMGARDAGTAPSGSIPGRVLPRLTLTL